MADRFINFRRLPAVVLLSVEPHEFGDWWVTATGAEMPPDPDLLRSEGVPLRRNHDDECERPTKPKRKRVWTKAGWRTR
jgi:hypothetical protein